MATKATVQVDLDDLNLLLGLVVTLRMNFAIRVEQLDAYKRINNVAIEATHPIARSS